MGALLNFCFHSIILAHEAHNISLCTLVRVSAPPHFAQVRIVVYNVMQSSPIITSNDVPALKAYPAK